VPIFTEDITNSRDLLLPAPASAYLHLITGQTNLILVARLPSADESTLAASVGVSLDPQPVALDAFVFILNDDNPVEELTTDQVKQIYSGKLKNWNEAGGENADIHPYQRDDESGSQELMRSLVMRGTPMIEAPDMVLPTMMAPFNTVSVDKQGIGYSVFYYEENMAPEAERVKPIAIDGVAPTKESIQAGLYPYTTEVYAVTLNSLPKDSLESHLKIWLASSAGQRLAEKSGMFQ
jgi:phosphate transport system substrate-binding protein